MGYEPTGVPSLVNGGGMLWLGSQILVYYSMGKTFNATVDWLGMVDNGGVLPGQDVDPSVNGEKAQPGTELSMCSNGEWNGQSVKTGCGYRDSAHNLYGSAGMTLGDISDKGMSGSARAGLGYSTHVPYSPLTGHLGLSGGTRFKMDENDTEFNPIVDATGSIGMEGEFGGNSYNWREPWKYGAGIYGKHDLTGGTGTTAGLYGNVGLFSGKVGYNAKTGPEATIGFGLPIRQEGGERERFINFIKDNEGGHDYIRNKNSAVKKMGEDGEWDGESYYKIFEEDTQTYYPYFIDDEGGATIGHGHHNDDVYETYKDGITIGRAEELLNSDVDNKMSDTEIWWTSKYGDGEWDKLDESTQYMLGDIAYNVGHIREYPIFANAIKKGDFETAENNYLRYKSTDGPLLGRNKPFMAEYLKPWMDVQKESIAIAPPLNEMPLPIGVYPTDNEGVEQTMTPNKTSPLNFQIPQAVQDNTRTGTNVFGGWRDGGQIPKFQDVNSEVETVQETVQEPVATVQEPIVTKDVDDSEARNFQRTKINTEAWLNRVIAEQEDRGNPITMEQAIAFQSQALKDLDSGVTKLQSDRDFFTNPQGNFQKQNLGNISFETAGFNITGGRTVWDPITSSFVEAPAPLGQKNNIMLIGDRNMNYNPWTLNHEMGHNWNSRNPFGNGSTQHIGNTYFGKDNIWNKFNPDLTGDDYDHVNEAGYNNHDFGLYQQSSHELRSEKAALEKELFDLGIYDPTREFTEADLKAILENDNLSSEAREVLDGLGYKDLLKQRYDVLQAQDAEQEGLPFELRDKKKAIERMYHELGSRYSTSSSMGSNNWKDMYESERERHNKEFGTTPREVDDGWGGTETREMSDLEYEGYLKNKKWSADQELYGNDAVYGETSLSGGIDSPGYFSYNMENISDANETLTGYIDDFTNANTSNPLLQEIKNAEGMTIGYSDDPNYSGFGTPDNMIPWSQENQETYNNQGTGGPTEAQWNTYVDNLFTEEETYNTDDPENTSFMKIDESLDHTYADEEKGLESNNLWDLCWDEDRNPTGHPDCTEEMLGRLETNVERHNKHRKIDQLSYNANSIRDLFGNSTSYHSESMQDAFSGIGILKTAPNSPLTEAHYSEMFPEGTPEYDARHRLISQMNTLQKKNPDVKAKLDRATLTPEFMQDMQLVQEALIKTRKGLQQKRQTLVEEYYQGVDKYRGTDFEQIIKEQQEELDNELKNNNITNFMNRVYSQNQEEVNDDLPQVLSAKYGGQHNWALDLRLSAQKGKEVISDDIYENDRYTQSASKYKKMLPKYQSEGALPKAQRGTGLDGLKDTWTDIKSAVNPYNYNRTNSENNNPLAAFLSGDFEKIPTYYGDDKDKAFGKAHNDLGGGKTFLHDGIRYKTDHAGETEHVGNNFFFATMEKAVEDGDKRVTQDVLDRFKEVWTELGQPDLEMGTDKYDHMLTGQSWDELGLDRSDHVNPLTDKLWIKAYKTKYPGVWMNAVIDELTHVKQQREMGRAKYMTKYATDLIGTFGDQTSLYGKEGTLEHQAHTGKGSEYKVLRNYILNGVRKSDKKKYGGSLPKAQTGWNDFEKSKVGKFIDAKGLRKEKDFWMEQFGYEPGKEEKDAVLDAAAIVNPIPDFIHAGTKFNEGKYTDAALYATFGIIPFSAAPLVRGTKKYLLNPIKDAVERVGAKRFGLWNNAGQSTTHTYNPGTKTWIDNNAPKVQEKLLKNDTEYLARQDYLTNKVTKLQQGKIKITEEIKQFKINNPGKPVPNDLLKIDNVINFQLDNYNDILDNVPPTYTHVKPGDGPFGLDFDIDKPKWNGPTMKSGNDDIIKRLNAELKKAEKLDLERIMGDYKWDNRNIFSKYFDTPKHPFNADPTALKPFWLNYDFTSLIKK